MVFAGKTGKAPTGGLYSGHVSGLKGNGMKRIDLESWSGRGMFRQFSTMDCPYFSVTMQYDATDLIEKAKALNASFFSMCLFAVTHALNDVEAFRYRVLANGDIVLHDKIDPVYLALREDKAITALKVPFRIDREAFEAARKAEEARTLALPEPWFYKGEERDVFFLSAVPWFTFTGMSHPIDLKEKYDSIVRMTLGKYEWRDGKAMMPVDIHAHHGFVDGYRLALFLQALDAFAQS